MGQQLVSLGFLSTAPLSSPPPRPLGRRLRGRRQWKCAKEGAEDGMGTAKEEEEEEEDALRVERRGEERGKQATDDGDGDDGTPLERGFHRQGNVPQRRNHKRLVCTLLG